MSVIQEKDLPGWVRLGLVPFIQLILAFTVAGLLIWMMGEDPVAATRLYIEKVLGTAKGLSQTLFYATTLTFTGLSVAMAFQAGMFNIGSEGQGMVGGIGIAVVALWILGPMLPDDLARSSFWFGQILLFAGAALFGMLWALIPALLQAYRGSHLVITTIMFNFIAGALLLFLLKQGGWLADPASGGDPKSLRFEESLWLHNLGDYFKGVTAELKSLGERPSKFQNAMKASKVNTSFLVAMGLCIAFWLFIWRTKWGYAIRAIGANPDAAHYAGINVRQTMVIAICLSGALAGMAMTNIILGSPNASDHVLRDNGLNGLGFIGIAVALMGRNHPIGIVLAALLFGSLYAWGESIQLQGRMFYKLDIDREFITAIQGLVVLFTGALAYMVVRMVLVVANLIWGRRAADINQGAA